MDKQSQLGFPNDPKYVAQQIKTIVHIMIAKMSLESQQKAHPNLRKKLKNLNIAEISSKETQGGSAIGASISLIKNILNGRDPYFIKMVIDELGRDI